MANWEAEHLGQALSARARRVGAVYSGPGAGNDVPQSERRPIAFTAGLPDPLLLPAGALAEAATAVLATGANAALQYGGSLGNEALREWLAAHWSTIGGIDLSAANFTITNGSAGALANVCDTFLDAGDVAFAEAPSFPGSVRTIRSVTPRIEAVAVDDDGLVVDDFESRARALIRAGEPVRLLYTIPNFHNPTGSTLSLLRRHQLLRVCHELGVLIVEDDAYGELWFGEPPPASLYALAGGEGVIRIGTFSKILAPGLRVGWAQATARVVDALVATRNEMGGSPLVHRIVEGYAASGALDHHLVEIRGVYASKRQSMLDELATSCKGLCGWNEPAGGFFAWVTLDPQVDPLLLGDAATDEGVMFVGGHVFFAEQTMSEGPRVRWGPGDSRFLRLAFSYVASEEIGEGIQRLGRALERAATR